jgi:hypothetical protein
MSAALVQEQDVEAVRIRLRERVDKDLEIVGVEVGQFQKEALATGGRHCAIDVEPFKDVLDRADGLYATRSQPTATNSEQAKATLILTKDPDGPRARGGNGGLEVGTAIGLEGRERFRVFLCGLVAAL